MLGNRGAIYLQVRPLRLQPFFKPRQYAGSTSSSSGHQEMVFTQPRGDTVIKDDAVSLAHQSVSALSFRQCRKDIRVDPIEENSGIRTLDIDLSEGRGVHHGHTLPGCNALTPNGIFHAFSRLREVPRSLPLSHVLEYRASINMPLMQRCDADGIGKQPAFTPGKCSEWDRHIRRPK